MSPLVLPLALAAIFFGCSADLADAPLRTNADAPVIVKLQLRDGALSLTATGGDGVRYSFEGTDGQSFAHLTLEELDIRAPELSELARSANARMGVAGSDAYLDASLGAVPVVHAVTAK